MNTGCSAIVLLLCFFCRSADAFGLKVAHRTSRECQLPRPSTFLCCSNSSPETTEIHPAVAGWPEKYTGSTEKLHSGKTGPRVLHNDFRVVKASEKMLQDLDVSNWPTWTTSDKEKWAVGNQNADKVMPYGELSYMISGKLEIVLPGGEIVLVEPGDFVTFPEGFKSSWRVLEELTWHYYLY